jgi:hypothetical protein
MKVHRKQTTLAQILKYLWAMQSPGMAIAMARHATPWLLD